MRWNAQQRTSPCAQASILSPCPISSWRCREAAINAVLHGNAYNPDKRITASFETSSDGLTVRICDQGAGFDPSCLPDPLAPQNLLRGSGRGIFLIRAFMDEVHFRQLHPGTELTLIKHRAPAKPVA